MTSTAQHTRRTLGTVRQRLAYGWWWIAGRKCECGQRVRPEFYGVHRELEHSVDY